MFCDADDNCYKWDDTDFEVKAKYVLNCTQKFILGYIQGFTYIDNDRHFTRHETNLNIFVDDVEFENALVISDIVDEAKLTQELSATDEQPDDNPEDYGRMTEDGMIHKTKIQKNRMNPKAYRLVLRRLAVDKHKHSSRTSDFSKSF